MKKRIICGIVSLICAFSCVACSGGNDSQDNPNGEWWETTGTLNTDENGKVVFEDVEIRLTTVVTGQDEEPSVSSSICSMPNTGERLTLSSTM